MKKILALLLAMTFCAVCFAGCGSTPEETTSDVNATTAANNSDSDYEYIKANGKMVIGITEYEPMNYRDKETKEWTGFDTEFAQAVAEELGVEAEFKVIDWDNKELELDARSIDAVWNGMTLTDEVKKSMSCTDPYVINAQVVVVRAEDKDKYATKDALKDAAFAAEAGSAGAAAIEDAFGTDNLTTVTAQSDALLEVQSGAADACVIDITMATAMTGEGSSYADLTTAMELTSEEYGIGFRLGSDMTEKVNEIIKDLKANGKLQELADKYQLTLAE